MHAPSFYRSGGFYLLIVTANCSRLFLGETEAFVDPVEKCVEYLFGENVIKPFRVLWIIAVPVGATASLDFIWLVADTLNALMAVPNLIALILLSPVVFRLTKEHFNHLS